MLTVENLTLHSTTLWVAMRGMRNPMNSWKLNDTYWTGGFRYNDGMPTVEIGPNDLKLAKRLSAGGSTHAKYRRMIVVTLDITAPLYWWKEFDTYKVGTVANSCSTMHKIHSRDLRMEDFSTEHICADSIKILDRLIGWLNQKRVDFLETKDKGFWYTIIQLLPCCYNQKRTVMLNYETIAKIRAERKGHKLDEWNQLIEAFETLPYVKDLC